MNHKHVSMYSLLVSVNLKNREIIFLHFVLLNIVFRPSWQTSAMARIAHIFNDNIMRDEMTGTAGLYKNYKTVLFIRSKPTLMTTYG